MQFYCISSTVQSVNVRQSSFFSSFCIRSPNYHFSTINLQQKQNPWVLFTSHSENNYLQTLIMLNGNIYVQEHKRRLFQLF